MSYQPTVHPGPSHSRRRRSLPILAGAALAGLLTAGCAGGGDEAGGVASLGGKATTTTAAGQPADADESLRKFQLCMKENGVEDMATGGVQARDSKGGGGPDTDPDFERAREACKHLLSGVALEDGSAPNDPKANDALVAYARCMRDEGIDMPDPKDGGIFAQPGDDTADPEEPRFKQAHAKCAKHTDGRLEEANPSA